MAPIATTNDPKLAQAGEDNLNRRLDASYYSNHQNSLSEGKSTRKTSRGTSSFEERAVKKKTTRLAIQTTKPGKLPTEYGKNCQELSSKILLKVIDFYLLSGICDLTNRDFFHLLGFFLY